MDLVRRVLDGDRRALARALTLVENGGAAAEELRAALGARGSGREGGARRIGITGPPGAGKSTLVSALTRELRALGKTIAILAIDPSSPITGGALLGDRIRMGEHAGDAGVFVRSVASRGARGGLAEAAGAMADVLSGAGFEVVLLETVGAGQADHDVALEAELNLVVLAPGCGDGIQGMKSGLLEIADLWVVNKADHPEAEAVRTDLVGALSLRRDAGEIDQRVLLVSARTGDGVAALAQRLLEAGFDPAARSGRLSRRAAARIEARAERALQEVLAADPAGSSRRAGEVADGRASLAAAARDLLREAAARLEAEETKP